jgi:CheY-like chemotaxis protein
MEYVAYKIKNHVLVEIFEVPAGKWGKLGLLMRDLILKGEINIIFKLKADVIICAHLLSVLIRTALEIREIGGTAAIVCGNKEQEDILRKMKMETMLSIYRDECAFRADLNICQATILCVDDEESALNAIKRTLFDQPYHVVTAQTGEDALKMAREESPDLALVDIMMPGMTGFDVVKMLRRLRPDMGIIMVTAFDDEKMVLLSATMHCEGFIEKPWEPSWLKNEIASVLARREHELL